MNLHMWMNNIRRKLKGCLAGSSDDVRYPTVNYGFYDSGGYLFRDRNRNIPANFSSMEKMDIFNLFFRNRLLDFPNMFAVFRFVSSKQWRAKSLHFFSMFTRVQHVSSSLQSNISTYSRMDY